MMMEDRKKKNKLKDFKKKDLKKNNKVRFILIMFIYITCYDKRTTPDTFTLR